MQVVIMRHLICCLFFCFYLFTVNSQSVSTSELAKLNNAISSFSEVSPFGINFSKIEDNKGNQTLINRTASFVYPLGMYNIGCSRNNLYISLFDTKGSDKNQIIDSMGHIVNYDTLKYSSYVPDGDFVYVRDVSGLAGLLDNKRNIILPCKYNYIERVKNSNFLILSDSLGNSALSDSKGRLIIDFKYSNISLPIISKDGLPSFDGSEMAETNKGKFFLLRDKNSKMSVWDAIRKEQTPSVFDGLYEDVRIKIWNEKLAFVQGVSNGKLVVFNNEFKSVKIEDNIKHVFLWRDCNVILGTEKGVLHSTSKILDKDGNVVDKLIINENIYWRFNKGKWTLCDKTEKSIAGPFDEFQYFGQGHIEDRFVVGKNGKYGVVDDKGNIIIPIENPFVAFLNNGNIMVDFGSTGFSYYSHNGERLTKENLLKYNSIFYYDHEKAPNYSWYQNTKGKWGMCRREDMKVLVPFVCDKAGSEFSYGMAVAYYAGRPYYINENGEGLPSNAYK